MAIQNVPNEYYVHRWSPSSCDFRHYYTQSTSPVTRVPRIACFMLRSDLDVWCWWSVGWVTAGFGRNPSVGKGWIYSTLTVDSAIITTGSLDRRNLLTFLYLPDDQGYFVTPDFKKLQIGLQYHTGMPSNTVTYTIANTRGSKFSVYTLRYWCLVSIQL